MININAHEIEKELKCATEAESREMRLLRNKVTDEEIAEVVSRWTGIPVAKMLLYTSHIGLWKTGNSD